MTDCRPKQQAPISQRARIVMCFTLITLGLIFSVTLSACGKKPGAVDPPPDVTEDHFPYVYPDPAADPKP